MQPAQLQLPDALAEPMPDDAGVPLKADGSPDRRYRVNCTHAMYGAGELCSWCGATVPA